MTLKQVLVKLQKWVYNELYKTKNECKSPQTICTAPWHDARNDCTTHYRKKQAFNALMKMFRKIKSLVDLHFMHIFPYFIEYFQIEFDCSSNEVN